MSRNRFVRWPLALATLLSLTSLAQPALAATRTISDNQGEKQIPTEAQRLVVFNPTILDTLDALGVSVAAVPKVETALPEFLKKYQTSSALNAGSMFEPDFEALSQYQPDLIIAGGRTTNAGTELAKLAPTLNFDRDDRHFPDSLRQQTLKLGEVFGKNEQAKALVAKFDAKLSSMKPKVEKAGTAVVVMVTGGKMSAFGPGTRMGFVYDALGFKPALTPEQFAAAGGGARKPGEGGKRPPEGQKSDSQKGPQAGSVKFQHGKGLSAELLHKANPDWIFVIDRDAAIGRADAQPAAKVLDNALVNQTSAAKNKHIVYLNSAELYVAGGITTFLHALDDVDQALTR